ncbi:RrF2 family transcriptional regulator [Thermotoga caldifontis]|uniref:RrF2 family transcriptional regulator n=1 Tax=Thermotoga caldifontis TaxID=1508419 RepID=UPI000693589C|nr:Rrf2 family transcriptional regulator [Thermotoga caldifontis]
MILLAFTIKSEYAFRIILSIAGCEKLTSLTNVCKGTKVPKEFAEKIVLQLRKAGILKAKRGRSGGYELAKDPSQITAYDIVAAVDDLEKITKCSRELCNRAGTEICTIKTLVWDRVMDCIRETLTRVTLQELLGTCGREKV